MTVSNKNLTSLPPEIQQHIMSYVAPLTRAYSYDEAKKCAEQLVKVVLVIGKDFPEMCKKELKNFKKIKPLYAKYLSNGPENFVFAEGPVRSMIPFNQEGNFIKREKLLLFQVIFTKIHETMSTVTPDDLGTFEPPECSEEWQEDLKEIIHMDYDPILSSHISPMQNVLNINALNVVCMMPLLSMNIIELLLNKGYDPTVLTPEEHSPLIEDENSIEDMSRFSYAPFYTFFDPQTEQYQETVKTAS